MSKFLALKIIVVLSTIFGTSVSQANPFIAASLYCAGPQAPACFAILGLATIGSTILASKNGELLIPEIDQHNISSSDLEALEEESTESTNWIFTFTGLLQRSPYLIKRSQLSKMQCLEIRGRVIAAQKQLPTRRRSLAFYIFHFDLETIVYKVPIIGSQDPADFIELMINYQKIDMSILESKPIKVLNFECTQSHR